MSKAVLIIDMPNYCKECSLRKDIYCKAVKEDNNIGYYLNNKDPSMYKPEWCPLKEMPERRKYNEEYFNGDVKGWNDCLKTILGEK